MNKENIKKVVLAYSGGLDTSIIIPWLKENYNNCEVIAVSGNVGQADELEGLEEKALKTGASKLYVLDLTDDYVDNYIIPCMKAGAVYEEYLLGTSHARPCIAKGLVDIALKEGADAICHGCTGKGNDQVRFELAAAALAPDLKIIAPWRDESFRSQFPGRKEMIDYCVAQGLPVEASMKKPYSMDRNLLHISYEAGIMEDPWFDAFCPENKAMFKLSVAPEDAPDAPEFIELDFEKGNCVAIDGKKMSPLEVMQTLNKLGGKHGIGRVDMVENRFVGMKSRGVYETPGGAILFFAHRQMESITMDRDTMHLRDSLIPKYAELVYNGFWYAPERLALQALVTETQKNVTGTVRVKLYKGNCYVAGRKSPCSLYNPDIATMEADPTNAYDQDDASGFIHLNALRLKVNAKVNGPENMM